MHVNLKGLDNLVLCISDRHLSEFVGLDYAGWVYHFLSSGSPPPRPLVSKSFESWLQKCKSGLFEVKPDGRFRSLATGPACVSLLHLLHGERRQNQ
jgi:hypothetical protein